MDLANYQPVSNLLFLGKVIDRAAALMERTMVLERPYGGQRSISSATILCCTTHVLVSKLPQLRTTSQMNRVTELPMCHIRKAQ